MIQFGNHNIGHFDGDEEYWCFNTAMIGMCSPVFDDCDSNYDVAQRLKKAGVITQGMEEDSETCALVVYFKSEAMASEFISRLNQYLKDWEKQTPARLDPMESLLLPKLRPLMRIARLSHDAYVTMSDEEMFDLLQHAHSISNDIFSELETKGYVCNKDGWPVARIEPSDS